MAQTAEFLGRKVARKLKATKTSVDAEAAAAGRGGGDEEHAGEEVLGRERRKEGADPLDLEVIDDRDLYQYLLKVFAPSLCKDPAVHFATEGKSSGNGCATYSSPSLRLEYTGMLICSAVFRDGICWQHIVRDGTTVEDRVFKHGCRLYCRLVS